jgi:hypothetical protein
MYVSGEMKTAIRCYNGICFFGIGIRIGKIYFGIHQPFDPATYGIHIRYRFLFAGLGKCTQRKTKEKKKPEKIFI